MEDAFKVQVAKLDEMFQQHQEVVSHLFDLEKLWVAEE